MAASTLPDGTDVEDLTGLKRYLLKSKMDRVVFSFLKHLSAYANGRDLSYNETVWLEEQSRELEGSECRLQDLLHVVIGSDIFLTK